jgi:predicted type IV restriction endonuclease
MHGADGPRIFDPVRRRWVALTPEEWVRQHFLNHLIADLGCPPGLIAVERGLRLHGRDRRTDIVVHGHDGHALVLVECKAPAVRLTQAAFEQAARYNSVHRVRWLVVTNGLVHYCCVVDHQRGDVRFMDRLPPFGEMQGR